MISHLSESIARFFYSKNIIPKNEIDSYAYGYQIIFIAIINWGIILAIMLLTGRIVETLMYMLSIIILRHHTGGYHASSHLRCCALSVCIYVLILVLLNITPTDIKYVISILITSISLLLILKLAPIEHRNNSIGESCFKKHRFYSIVLSIFFSLLSIVFVLLKHITISFSLSLGMFQVSMFLLIEHFINKKREEE